MRSFLFLLFFGCMFQIHAETKVLAFAGSTRKDSYNKMLVEQAASIAQKQGVAVTVIDLNDFQMPLYDADCEEEYGLPKNAKKFRELMIQSDAIIIASPEYNGSLSAVLKNTIDWASRTEDASGSRAAFKDKKFALMSASPGKGGGSRGLAHLRTILENLGAVVIKKQVSIGSAHEAFSEDGELKSKDIQKQLQDEITSLLK